MKALAPKATVDKVLFPKLFAGEFGAEISALLTSNSQVIHSSFWDGDLESFIFQSAARGLPQRIPMVYTTGETSHVPGRQQAAGWHHHRRPRPARADGARQRR